MSDEEIIKAWDLLDRLSALSSTAGIVLLYVVNTRGIFIFDTFVQLAHDARDAMKSCGDPKLWSLLDELANLTRRFKRSVGDQPAEKLKFRQSAADQPEEELNPTAQALYIAAETACNYVVTRVFPIEDHGSYGILTRPGHDPLRLRRFYIKPLAEIVKHFGERFGATSEDEVDIIVLKLTQYLSTLCINSRRER